jgi:ABC-2 type transport system ATP-binding protein
MLVVNNLTKRWGEVLALDGVSFEVGRGEVVGFLGPNGAGKTTTMRIITGFIPPTSGTVSVDGHDVFTDSLAVRRLIGYLPENTPIYPDMRVGEYLRFRAQLKGVARRERGPQVAHVMDRCMIADVERKLVGTLSKGYRQRVGLADALLGNPTLLILDEPTAGMDPNQVREVRKLVKELGEHHTIILSTHILPEVEATCSRAVIISGGRIVAQDQVRALQRSGGGGRLEVETLEAGPDFAEVVRLLPGVRSVMKLPAGTGGVDTFHIEALEDADVREVVARKAMEKGVVIRELRPVARGLEEIFVRYTAGDPSTAALRAPSAQGERVRGHGDA